MESKGDTSRQLLCLAPLYSHSTPQSLRKANVVVTQGPPGLLCLLFMKTSHFSLCALWSFPRERFVLDFLRTALSQKLEGSPLSQGVSPFSCCISPACRCCNHLPWDWKMLEETLLKTGFSFSQLRGTILSDITVCLVSSPQTPHFGSAACSFWR